MRNTTPYSCKKQKLGAYGFISFGIALIMSVCLLIAGIVNFDIFIYFFFVAAVNNIFYSLRFAKFNKAMKQEIENYNDMIKLPFVEGNIVGRRNYLYHTPNCFSDVTDKGIQARKGVMILYRYEVSFISPVNGVEQTILSEYYTGSQTRAYDKLTVLVHYSPVGKYMVELKK